MMKLFSTLPGDWGNSVMSFGHTEEAIDFLSRRSQRLRRCPDYRFLISARC